MFLDNDSSIFRDVPGNFFCPLLINKASKPPDIHIVSLGKRVFNNAEKSLHRYRNVRFINARLLSNPADYVCFSH